MRLSFKRVLIVEDDSALRAAITRSLRSWLDAENAVVLEAGTVAEACRLLSRSPSPDLLLVDIRLPDESAFRVLDVAASASPSPLVVAISGKASPIEAFQLAQRGVRAYLAKPFSLLELAETLERASVTAPDLKPLITASVGRVPMRELQSEVRRVMIDEALALTDGSRSGAARLLRVTRQAVQQMLQSDDESEPEQPAPKTPGA